MWYEIRYGPEGGAYYDTVYTGAADFSTQESTVFPFPRLPSSGPYGEVSQFRPLWGLFPLPHGENYCQTGGFIMKEYRVGIIGATGMVGQRFRSEERRVGKEC